MKGKITTTPNEKQFELMAKFVECEKELESIGTGGDFSEAWNRKIEISKKYNETNKLDILGLANVTGRLWSNYISAAEILKREIDILNEIIEEQLGGNT